VVRRAIAASRPRSAHKNASESPRPSTGRPAETVAGARSSTLRAVASGAEGSRSSASWPTAPPMKGMTGLRAATSRPAMSVPVSSPPSSEGIEMLPRTSPARMGAESSRLYRTETAVHQRLAAWFSSSGRQETRRPSMDPPGESSCAEGRPPDPLRPRFRWRRVKGVDLVKFAEA
jgi:hypothetical protein